MKKEIETFRNPSDYAMRQLTQDKPDCFNGAVSVNRYLVTVEEIAEPDEVIIARIQKLWAECDNFHHVGALRAAAKEYGVDLDFKDYAKSRKKAA